jgi:RNA 2',3'-cyclic 3'-phosphodiesterase
VSGVEAPERVRLFVALELPENVREALTRWRERVPEGSRDLRLIAREHLHATLCFLGWQSSDQVAAIGEACRVVAAQPAPPLRIGEAIWLPPRRPRVLAISLEDDTGSLATLQAALSETLADGGWYEPEKRRYLGHVTVARAGRGVRAPKAELCALPPLEFRACRVTMYRSRLLRSGARYEPLSTIELSTP